MRIKNYDIEGICNLLFNLELRGTDSRMRTKMVIILSSHLEEVEKYRISLVEENVLRNSDGSVSFVKNELQEDTEVVNLNPDTSDEFHKEYHILMNEELFIEESDSNENMIKSVTDSITNCDVEFSREQAIEYDRWCDIFENSRNKYVNKTETQE